MGACMWADYAHNRPWQLFTAELSQGQEKELAGNVSWQLSWCVFLVLCLPNREPETLKPKP